MPSSLSCPIFSLLALVVTALWRAEAENPLRDVAPRTYRCWQLSRSRAACCTWWDGASTWPIPGSGRLWIGLTIFWIALLFYVRIVKPLFMLRRPYRVAEVRRNAATRPRW